MMMKSSYGSLDAGQEAARERITALTHLTDKEKIDFRWQIRNGIPWEQILKEATELDTQRGLAETRDLVPIVNFG